MASRRAGIAIGRRRARLIILEQRRRAPLRILQDLEIQRPAGMTPAEAVGSLLDLVAPASLPLRVGIALSSGDFACDDVFRAPEGMKPREIAAVAPVLLEARSAGETLERLAVDIRINQGGLEVAALEVSELNKLQEVCDARGVGVGFISSIPSTLAQGFPSADRIALLWAWQRIEVERRDGSVRWRSIPTDRVRGEECSPALALGGLALDAGQIAAVAAAIANAEAVPDVLRGAPNAPRTMESRYRTPLRILGVAASLLLLAAGIHFRAQEKAYHLELEAARSREGDLWKRLFPDRPLVQGDLLRLSREKLQGPAGGSADGSNRSAFLSFVELGRCLPNVEELGMTLESLDLSPEGGRLQATVTAASPDLLRNAALLEAKLNDSAKIAARGDFESRGSDVQVRLKLDYRGR